MPTIREAFDIISKPNPKQSLMAFQQTGSCERASKLQMETLIMSDFIYIPIENVIREGQTVASKLCDTKYVIYYNKKEKRGKVRINTYYLVENNMIKLCKYYDRGLCDTIEDYHKLDIDYIDSQAYGSWMDGAR